MVQIPDRRHLRFGLGYISQRILEAGNTGLPSRAISIRHPSIARCAFAIAGTIAEMQLGQTLKYPAHSTVAERLSIWTLSCPFRSIARQAFASTGYRFFRATD
jgi:hypothetical protein